MKTRILLILILLLFFVNYINSFQNCSYYIHEEFQTSLKTQLDDKTDFIRINLINRTSSNLDSEEFFLLTSKELLLLAPDSDFYSFSLISDNFNFLHLKDSDKTGQFCNFTNSEETITENQKNELFFKILISRNVLFFNFKI